MQNQESFSIQKIINVFGADIHRDTLAKAERLGQVPQPQWKQTGSLKARRWTVDQLPAIGERFGFLPKLDGPQAICVFSMKGGVLKTTLSFNIARLAALHNMKVCVVGLDTQGDITKALSPEVESEDTDLATVAKEARTEAGLFDVLRGTVSVFDALCDTDLPTLKFIRETPGLAKVDMELVSRPHREWWLKKNIVEPLKTRFDLVVLDCAPSWSTIISNALCSADLLVSPIETKISHFRNLDDFTAFLSDFERAMEVQPIEKVFVPTKYQSGRKLSSEIRSWYVQNIKGCTAGVIREAMVGEEAMTACKSLPEHAPTSAAASEMRDLMLDIFRALPTQATQPKQVAEAAA